MSKKRKRPNYTKEFKQDAVKLVTEQRYSCPEVGRRLGVAASNVTRWVRQYRQDQQDLSEGVSPAGIWKPRTGDSERKTSGLRWSAKY